MLILILLCLCCPNPPCWTLALTLIKSTFRIRAKALLAHPFRPDLLPRNSVTKFRPPLWDSVVVHPTLLRIVRRSGSVRQRYSEVLSSIHCSRRCRSCISVCRRYQPPSLRHSQAAPPKAIPASGSFPSPAYLRDHNFWAPTCYLLQWSLICPTPFLRMQMQVFFTEASSPPHMQPPGGFEPTTELTHMLSDIHSVPADALSVRFAFLDLTFCR